jgi:hypothetical protein
MRNDSCLRASREGIGQRPSYRQLRQTTASRAGATMQLRQTGARAIGEFHYTVVVVGHGQSRRGTQRAHLGWEQVAATPAVASTAANLRLTREEVVDILRWSGCRRNTGSISQGPFAAREYGRSRNGDCIRVVADPLAREHTMTKFGGCGHLLISNGIPFTCPTAAGVPTCGCFTYRVLIPSQG